MCCYAKREIVLTSYGVTHYFLYYAQALLFKGWTLLIPPLFSLYVNTLPTSYCVRDHGISSLRGYKMFAYSALELNQGLYKFNF